jgi:hypothetical protein
LYEGTFNVEYYKGEGLRKANGYTVTSTITGNSAILGLAESTNGDDKYLLANSAAGKLYEINTGSGATTEISTGFSTTAKVTYLNFKDTAEGTIVNDGINDPKFIKNSGGTWSVAACNTGATQRGSALGQYKHRAFIGAGGKLVWSALGDPTDWSTLDDAGENANFANESSTISAMLDYGNFFAIHKEAGKIYYLLGDTDPDNWVFDQLANAKGAYSQRDVVNFNREQWFFDNGLFTLESFDKEGNVTVGGEKSENINKDFENWADSAAKNYFILGYHKRNQLRIYYQRNGDSYIKNCWIYDLQDKAWYHREYDINITCGCIYDGEIYLGTSTGLVLHDDTGSTFNGVAVTADLIFPFFHFGSVDELKELGELVYSLDSQNTQDFQILQRLDNQKDLALINVKTVSANDDSLIWDDGTWDDDSWGQYFVNKVKYFPKGAHYTWQFGLRAVNSTDNFCLRSMIIKNITIGES